MNFSDFDPIKFTVMMVVLVIAITIHEFCHAKFADLAGDPTPRLQGRVTLSPLSHLDPMGSIMIVLSSLSGFGIGWGRPVMVDPRRMRNPRWDHFVSVIAGPLSNLLQATIFGIVIRILINSGVASPQEIILSRDPLFMFLSYGVFINLGLCFFNLIPIGPLDGHWILGTFMSERARLEWYRFNRGPGTIIFIILVLMPGFTKIDLIGLYLEPVVFKTAGILLGLPLG